MQTNEILSISKLEKTYSNGVKALKGVDLKIAEGDFFALLGANGAGKTTIIGIITGVVNKTAGKVLVGGIDIDRDHDAAKKLIGVVPQEFNFNIFEKVLDIVVQQAGFFGVPRKVALARAEVVLNDLDLWGKKDMASRTLSGGMKRRLMIARALMHQPKFLILDEPTAGVDVELRRGMWQYLQNLNANGTTILLTTHYLEEVEELCRNVAIIKEGQIVREDTVKNLVKSLEKRIYLVNLAQAKENWQAKDLVAKRVDDLTLELELSEGDSLGEAMAKLHLSGLVVDDVKPKGNRLEQLFLNILQK